DRAHLPLLATQGAGGLLQHPPARTLQLLHGDAPGRRRQGLSARRPRRSRVKVPPPLTPPHKGEGGIDATESPSPLWGGVRGGGAPGACAEIRYAIAPTFPSSPALTAADMPGYI